jgi:esterase/lipase
MEKLRIKSAHFLAVFVFYVSTLAAQSNVSNGPTHIQVKRLNDSFIDVYYNTVLGDKKIPVLIFCQGSGYDSNTKGFLGLAKKFEDKAVGLAIEKEGVKYGDKGDSLTDIYKENNAVYNRLYDYLRVLEYLRANAKWWNGDVYVIGASEGGLLAGMLASYYPNVKAAAILSFGCGLSFGEAWPISIGLQERNSGTPSDSIAIDEKMVSDSLAYIRQHPSLNKSYNGADNTFTWWGSIMDLRLSNSLIDLSIPIYLAQGTRDIMSPLVSAQKLNKEFIEKGKKNLYYKEYEGYDHEYKDTTGKSHVVQVFVDATDWILNQK